MLKRVDSDEGDTVRSRAALGDSCEDHINNFGSVVEIGVTSVVAVECTEIVEKASDITYGVDDDVRVGDRRERCAEIKDDKGKRITDRAIWVSGGEETGELLGPGVKCNQVIDAPAPQDEAVLMVFCKS